MVKKALIVAMLLPLMACTTSQLPPLPVENPRQVWCDHNEPDRRSPEAILAMSRAERDRLNKHNRQGEAWCGWEA